MAPVRKVTRTVLTLKRFESCKSGVFGVLTLPTGQEYYTLEEEQLGNKPRVSCIPAGTYTCQRSHFNKGGYECFEVLNVPGRSQIKIHKGNTEEDIEGCIVLGVAVDVFKVIDEDSKREVRKFGVKASRVAFLAFMARMDGASQFVLKIEDPS
jgi:hypothetical protein